MTGICLWLGELCWREGKLLVEPPMSNRSKRRDQTKCSPWSSKLGVRLGAYDTSPRKFTITKPPEEIHGGGQDQHRVVAPTKTKKKLTAVTFSESTYIRSCWFTDLLKLCRCTAIFKFTFQNPATSNAVTSWPQWDGDLQFDNVIGYQHLLARYRNLIPFFSPSIQVPKHSEQRCQISTTSVR
jgi:hypothetical protein